jgi:Protein of unknown function (DUF4229)
VPLPRPSAGGRATVAYTALRFALFAACLVLGALAGLRGLLLLVIALFVSGLLSFFVLSRQRAAMSIAVDGLISRTRTRLRSRTDAEDAYVDHVIAEQGSITRSDR